MTRTFDLGVILTITTGRLVASGGIHAVHELLDYMASDQLLTHQLPRAAEECQPELLRQHPDLSAVEVPDEFPHPPEQSVPAWLADQVARFGSRREVSPLAPEDHTRINPLAELAMMRPDMPVIALRSDKEPDQ